MLIAPPSAAVTLGILLNTAKSKNTDSTYTVYIGMCVLFHYIYIYIFVFVYLSDNTQLKYIFIELKYNVETCFGSHGAIIRRYNLQVLNY
jgi:hypothetical protein